MGGGIESAPFSASPLIWMREMFSNKVIIIFVTSLILTLIFSWKGDDDVAYLFFAKKPTGTEAIRRIRFVLSKSLASVTGGALTSVILVKYIITKVFNNIIMSNNKILLLIILSIFIFSALIGLIQNVIRLVRGRSTRPIVDFSILKFNIINFVRPRK